MNNSNCSSHSSKSWFTPLNTGNGLCLPQSTHTHHCPSLHKGQTFANSGHHHFRLTAGCLFRTHLLRYIIQLHSGTTLFAYRSHHYLRGLFLSQSATVSRRSVHFHTNFCFGLDAVGLTHTTIPVWSTCLISDDNSRLVIEMAPLL
uniref:Uncharacterized protein n=1 Tax=Ditylenchus dipsaci TaxID=166011 RepID=A0A915D7A4_9BILA